MIAALLNNDRVIRSIEALQVIGWDRGRPARITWQPPGWHFTFLLFAFALICGRDARGPSQSLEWLQTGPALFNRSSTTSLQWYNLFFNIFNGNPDRIVMKSIVSSQ